VSRWPVPDTKYNVLALNKNAPKAIRREMGIAAIAQKLAVKRKVLSALRSVEWGRKISEVQILNVLT